ncbi:hypothetical protein C2S53_002135 [Perilla frutescens var. hirtella]|uniref:Uncharacterized protein n=1 Tax=Perilla frutescens var. hirtella TaxID=608512 RepID=A0AAD4PDI9_PERFH|nr:hypothetical protein C2S53_002135 [Perilla frutescens var. hirtella]
MMIMSTLLHLILILSTTTLLSTAPTTVSGRLFYGQPSTGKHGHEVEFHLRNHSNHASINKEFGSEKRRVPTGSNPLHNRR